MNRSNQNNSDGTAVLSIIVWLLLETILIRIVVQNSTLDESTILSSLNVFLVLGGITAGCNTLCFLATESKNQTVLRCSSILLPVLISVVMVSIISSNRFLPQLGVMVGLQIFYAAVAMHIVLVWSAGSLQRGEQKARKRPSIWMLLVITLLVALLIASGRLFVVQNPVGHEFVFLSLVTMFGWPLIAWTALGNHPYATIFTLPIPLIFVGLLCLQMLKGFDFGFDLDPLISLGFIASYTMHALLFLTVLRSASYRWGVAPRSV